MDLSIAALLTQDGITNGAIYALLALALVLVFAVTRIIWVPSGEFVAYGTLTLAGLQLGKAPGTVSLLIGMAIAAGVLELYACIQRGEIASAPRRLLLWTGVPCVIAALVWWSAPLNLPFPVQVALTLAAVAALGPLLYRIAYQPIAEASVLVLLIVSVAVHFTLTGLGLWFFGAEGSRTPAFASASFQFGNVNVNVQSLLVVGTSAALIGVLYVFFGRTLYGKALRATAVNRVGARLVGILRRSDRANYDYLLRLRLPGEPQGLRRRNHRRPGQLSAGRRRRIARRIARVVFIILGERVQGSNRLHADHSGAVVAKSDDAPSRRR